MSPIWHVMGGVGMGAVMYQTTQNWQLAISSASAEVLLDLDHIIDHLAWSEHPFCLKTFLSRDNMFSWPRIILVLHSYEFIVLLTALSWYLNKPFLWAINFGAIIHLIMDEIGNRRFWPSYRISSGFYFFSYRLMKRFRSRDLMHLR